MCVAQCTITSKASPTYTFLEFEPTMHKHMQQMEITFAATANDIFIKLISISEIRSDMFLRICRVGIKKIHSCLYFLDFIYLVINLKYQTLIILMTIFPSLIIFPFCKSNDVKFCNSHVNQFALKYYT